MKIIVDTNIVFSALLRTQSIFGQIIFNSTDIFVFYSPHYLKFEIRKNWKKLRSISKLTDQQLEESYESLLTKIEFINEDIITQKVWEDSEKIVSKIDIDDIAFVALAKYLKGTLWTGDLKLRNGLQKNGFKKVLTTDEVVKFWTKRKS